MGLFDRMLGRSAPPTRKAEAIPLHAGALIEVVGESYRQDAPPGIVPTSADPAIG